MDLVSVILPVHNREATIKRAMESVLNQSYADMELIIVDDASDDNTVEIIKQYDDERIMLIQRKIRGGAAKARNTGLKRTRGRYIAFQDSDDEWMPHKLEKQLRYMQKENYQVSFTPYELRGEKTFIVPDSYQQLDSRIIKDILKKRNIIGTPTLVLEKEVIDNVGVFDESMSAWEDYELVIRVAEKYAIGCVKEILLHAYRQEQSVSCNYGNLICSAMYIMRRHMDFIEKGDFYDSLKRWVKELTSYYTDFMALEQCASKLPQIEKEYLYKVFSQALCKKYNVKKDCLEAMCGAFEARLRNRAFSIYGAGVMARKTYERLKQRHVLPLSFVVTSMGNDKEIDGIPIVELDRNLDVDMPFLIAVSPKYHKEVAEQLRKLGYLNYAFAMETTDR